MIVENVEASTRSCRAFPEWEASIGDVKWSSNGPRRDVSTAVWSLQDCPISRLWTESCPLNSANAKSTPRSHRGGPGQKDPGICSKRNTAQPAELRPLDPVIALDHRRGFFTNRSTGAEVQQTCSKQYYCRKREQQAADEKACRHPNPSEQNDIPTPD